MYTCLCKGVTDRQIRQLAQGQPTSVRGVQKQCLAGTDCGMCLAEIKKIIVESAGASD